MNIDEYLIDKFLTYNTIGTYLNLLEVGIEEINDSDLTKKFKELQEIIMKQREDIGEMEIKELEGENAN